MTRDELIGRVAQRINGVENKWLAPTRQHYFYAEAALVTIFDALKEPTDDMILIGEIAQSVSAGLGEDCDVQVQETYRAMLNASPLARRGGNDS